MTYGTPEAIGAGAFLDPVVRSLDIGVALVRAEDFGLLYENGRFFEWFPAAGEEFETLQTRIPGLNADAARAAREAREPFEQDFEISSHAGIANLRVRLTALPEAEGPGDVLLVQLFDISAEKEAEYMLDSYSRMAEKNARELQREKERAEKLLLNIMPRPVYEELRDYGTTTPQRFDQATVLMLDFIGFTDMAISRDPGALVAELNDIFSAFDRIVELFGCERIKTIGDAYVAVSGLPEETSDHATNIAKVALRMRRYLEKRNSSHPTQWTCRMGIASGPVIGSMVGIQKYVYDIFGPAVNLAARLEQLSGPMQITLSETTSCALGHGFVTRERGNFEVRGFDEQRLFALEYETNRR